MAPNSPTYSRRWHKSGVSRAKSLILSSIWRSSDYIERAIFVALALMLAYTLFVVVRFFSRYYSTRRALSTLGRDPTVEFSRKRKTLLAELSRGLGTLKSISMIAPFLGLAGTCYGIAGGLFVGFGLLKSLAERILMTNVAATLVTTAAGILVAIPATVAYTAIRTRIETFSEHSLRNRNSDKGEATVRSFHFAQTLPLEKRFSRLPSFAIVAAPALASIVSLFLAFEPYETPTGLPVRLPDDRCDPTIVDRVVVLRVSKEGELFLNFEPEDRDGLARRLSDIYRMRQDRILYLQADDQVPFQTVADAIDLTRNSPEAETNSPDIQVILITPTAVRECGLVPIRRVSLNGRRR